MNENKKGFEAELVTSKELAKKLGCKEARIRYLDRKKKLGYTSMLRKDGRRVYLYDRSWRALDSLKKRLDLTDVIKDVNYLLLSVQALRRKVLEIDCEFSEQERQLLSTRLKV